MRKLRWFRVRILFLAALVAAGCRPALAPTDVIFQEVSGEWSYRATDVVGEGLVCTITGLTLRIEKIPGAGAFDGKSRGGRMDCRSTSDAFVYTLDLTEYPVAEGYTFNEFISFNIYTGSWRHEGMIDADSMFGTFRIVNGGSRFDGRFVAKRDPGSGL